MTWGFVAAGAATVASAYIQGEAAEDAANAQIGYGNRAIDLQLQSEREAREMMQPFVDPGLRGVGQLGLRGDELYSGAMPQLQQYTAAGLPALQAEQALLGLRGQEAYAEQIQQLQDSPLMQAAIDQSEEAILANASATGGLRGGNVQEALMRNRPNLLNQMVNQRLQGLQGLRSQGAGISQNLLGLGQAATSDVARLGQASAAGQAAGALSTAGQVSRIMDVQGASAAGAETAKGESSGGIIGGLIGGLGGLF